MRLAKYRVQSRRRLFNEIDRLSAENAKLTAELEELKECSLLLPCKVRDTVYVYDYPCEKINCEHFKEGSFIFRDDDDCNLTYEKCPYKVVVEISMKRIGDILQNCFDFEGDSRIGKHVFLTRGEAEDALVEKNESMD